MLTDPMYEQYCVMTRMLPIAVPIIACMAGLQSLDSDQSYTIKNWDLKNSG